MSSDLRFLAYRLAFVAGLIAAIAVQWCVVPTILNPWLGGNLDVTGDAMRWLDLAADAGGGLLAFLLAAPLPRAVEGLAGKPSTGS